MNIRAQKITLLLLLPLTVLACKFLIPEAPVAQVTPTDVSLFTETVRAPTAEIPGQATSTEIPAAPETATAPARSNTFTVVVLRPQDGDLNKQLTAEVEKARALGQIPVVEFDATW